VWTSSTKLIFLSPYVGSNVDLFPVVFGVSFIMDGVESVRPIFANFTVTPNPTLTPFSADKKEYRGEILSLQVRESSPALVQVVLAGK